MPSIIPPPGLCCGTTRSPLPPQATPLLLAFNNLQNCVSKYVPLGTFKCGVSTNYPSIRRDCRFLMKTVEVNVSYCWKAVSKYVSFSVWM